MRNRTLECFEVGVSYLKMKENGETKEVKEKYVIEAPTFGNAEEIAIREISSYVVDGGVIIRTIARPKYQDICFSEDAECENFYKVKILITELNDDGTEKELPIFHLVQAKSLEAARNAIISTVYAGSMADYEIASISKTSIIDVFEQP